LRTDLTYKEVDARKQELINRIFQLVPCGVGVGSKMRLSDSELERAVSEGIQWAVDKGYGWDRDASHTEEGGCMKEANPDKVSPRAKKRGSSQLGTLGAGNHFLEIARVDKIFHPGHAAVYGINRPGQVVVWVHTGSRGFGHQVATDYIRVMDRAATKYNMKLPARELVCAPLKSKEAEDYYEAMCCAVNWAFINRHIIMHQVRQAFEDVFKRSAEDMGMELVYGMTHNTAKKEEHEVDGRRVKAVVHRKTERGEGLSFASTAHGAGRVMSRTGARRRFRASDIINDLKRKGIVVKAASGRILEEESPDSYKDVHRVADVSHRVGLAEKVMVSVPIAVAKG